MPSQGRQKHEPTTCGAHCSSCLVVSAGCEAIEDIRAFEIGGEALREIGKRLSYFNTERPHSQHGKLTPNELMRGKRDQEGWQRNHKNRFILFLLLTGPKCRTTSLGFDCIMGHTYHSVFVHRRRVYHSQSRQVMKASNQGGLLSNRVSEPNAGCCRVNYLA